MANQIKYKNILFCTDYSQDAEVAFIHAFDQTNKHNARLHILSVMIPVNPCGIQIFKKPLSQSQSKTESEKLDEYYRLQELGGLKKVYNKRCQKIKNYKFIVKVGSPDVEILRYSEQNNIDMIILGTAGRRESKRTTFIRTAANVSKYADCQVITIGSPKQ